MNALTQVPGYSAVKVASHPEGQHCGERDFTIVR